MVDEFTPRTFQLGKTRNPDPKPEPGRRAKTPTSQSAPARAMATKGDVDKAIALLDTLYEAAGDGMDLFGLEATKEKWSEAVTKLRRINKDSLSASPKLAKSIANLGEGGGATTFFLMHIIIIAGVVPTARREMQGALSERGARHAAPSSAPDWDSFEQSFTQPTTEVPLPGGYNVGEHIPGL